MKRKTIRFSVTIMLLLISHVNVHAQQRKFTDKGAARYVQDFVNSTMHEVHLGGTVTGLSADFHYNMAQWTQRDVTEFAKCPNTYDTYEILLGIANTSVEVGKDGRYTKDALDAQAALEAIKPTGCKSWKGFARMIGDAADASQSERNKYHRKPLP